LRRPADCRAFFEGLGLRRLSLAPADPWGGGDGVVSGIGAKQEALPHHPGPPAGDLVRGLAPPSVFRTTNELSRLLFRKHLLRPSPLRPYAPTPLRPYCLLWCPRFVRVARLWGALSDPRLKESPRLQALTAPKDRSAKPPSASTPKPSEIGRKERPAASTLTAPLPHCLKGRSEVRRAPQPPSPQRSAGKCAGCLNPQGGRVGVRLRSSLCENPSCR